MKEERVALPEPFHSDLHYEQYTRADGEIVVRLLSPLVADTDYGQIIVPTDFESDGASIPWFARKIVGSPFNLEYLAQAIVHDYLYSKISNAHDLSRGTCDVIFRDLLWDTKVPKWKVPLFYMAVASCGWRFYKKK